MHSRFFAFSRQSLVLAPAAAAAASPASATAPSLAPTSSAATVVFAIPSVPVVAVFLVCGKLTGQPQRRGDRFRHRRRRFEGRFGWRRRRCWDHTLQPWPLGCGLARLTQRRPLQLGGQQSRRHSVGRRGEVHPIAGPHRCPVRRRQFLKGGLSRTQKFAKVNYLCLFGPVPCRRRHRAVFFPRREISHRSLSRLGL